MGAGGRLQHAQEEGDSSQQPPAGLTTPLLQQVQVEEEGERAHQPQLGSVHQLGGTPMLLTTAIMLADMFGLGTLSLPADLARLGWLPGLACVAWFAGANVYAGTLYQRLSLRVPEARVFDEIGRKAMGGTGAALVYACIYSSILLQPVILALTCVETLRQAFYRFNLSQAAAGWIVAGLVLPLSQVHHIEDVAAVSILGTLGMLAAMAIVAGKLLALYMAAPAAAPTELVARGQGVNGALVGVLDICFAWGGQINWLRYITTMRHRKQFSSAVAITTAGMAVVYVVVACCGYAAFGTAIDLHMPISSLLGQDAWTMAMNAGIFLHCLIAYQVNVNVWCSLLLHLTAPKYADELAATSSWRTKGLWLAVTLVCIAFGGCVAAALPYFSLVMAVIAALGDVMSMFGLPCLFCLRLLPLRRGERWLCRGLLALACALSAAGVFSSVQQLIEQATQ